MEPVLQLALDFVDSHRAIKCAEEAVKGGVTWLEAGTPLIKAEGLHIVRELRKRFPKATLVADMKTIDAGRLEVEIAAKAGANVVEVLALSSDACLGECVEAAKNYGVEIMADLIEVNNPVQRAKELESLGVHYIGVHTGIDEQMRGSNPWETLKGVCRAVKIPVAAAGGINSETAGQAVQAGASIIVVGGAIHKSADAVLAAKIILKAIKSRKAIKTDLFKRVGADQLKATFLKVSTANISDALHRHGDLPHILARVAGAKMAGPAVTVRTYPGDWAKPVEAIDKARPGDVIVVDAGGVGPAVWGELATLSALKKKVAGIVIDGALRDLPELLKMGLPAFSRLVMPTAGEPKGFGEINVPIKISGVRVCPGDWIVGDADGVVVVPREKAVESANRAMGVLESENRIRKEIEQGGTLSSVTELLKWEKPGHHE